MDLQLLKDEISVRTPLCDLTLETPVETEIVIPDYQPEIFKLVKSFLEPVIQQKQVLGGKLTLEGYYRLLVCYQSDETRSFCTLEQKLPFSRSADLKNLSQGRYFIEAAGETEYLNVRAVSQRRIDVKGAYAFRVQVSGETRQEVLLGAAGAGIQCRKTELSTDQLLCRLEKPFTAEDTLEFAQPPESVLTCRCTGSVSDIRLVSGKAVVKGSLHLTALYRAQAGCKLLRAEKDLPFSQIIDGEDLPDDCVCAARILPGGCTLVESDTADGALVSAGAVLRFSAGRKLDFSCVQDAFSTEFETRTEDQLVLTEEVVDRFSNTVTATAAGTLPDADAAIVECFATSLPPETVTENGELTIRGRVIAHLICENSLGELECYDKPCEYQLPKRYDTTKGPVTCELDVLFMQAAAHKNGPEASCEVTVSVSGTVCRKNRTPLLRQIECGDRLQRAEDGISLRICYGRAGEEIFALAKRYHADPSRIAKDSGVPVGPLEADARLLIPCGE